MKVSKKVLNAYRLSRTKENKGECKLMNINEWINHKDLIYRDGFFAYYDKKTMWLPF